MSTGRFTLPGEAGKEKIIKELAQKWGADAVRDSDGTTLSAEILDMGLDIYSTLCLIRLDNNWIKEHPCCRQQTYLMTEPITATKAELSIPLMASYYAQQFEPNTDADIKKYWQVMDRTEGACVNPEKWDYHNGTVTIFDAKAFHLYTVAFLAYQIWEPVSMYNHLTNNWQKEHLIPLDVRHPEAWEHILLLLEQWLAEHSRTDIVRFTTFFYNFDLIYDEKGKEKQVNWFGYLFCVSPLALETFEKEYGYALTPEDFVNAGKYHTPFENPDWKYLDWMDFNQKFVASCAKTCVDMVHSYQKKAIMFLGDHWAGTEPYGKYFSEIGLDAVVGAAGDGVTTRMIADIPVKETEARLYPYFFPDIFHDAGNPLADSVPIWYKCRRALLQKPTARIGYGGYPSLAYKFPDFIEHAAEVAAQFRSIHDESQGTSCYKAPFKIAVLNSWGKIRSWMTHQVAHSLWNQRCYSYLGVMEALAGLPFDVEFISFQDIKDYGLGLDIKVIINAGDEGTSWSGHDWWSDADIISKIRQWVYEGGGFIGIGNPSAFQKQGKYFQLEDVLGVQREVGYTASTNKFNFSLQKHFIIDDVTGRIDYGEGMSMIYPADKETAILDVENKSCSLTAHPYGSGRAVYMAGVPFNTVNNRIILRALYWCAGHEEEMYHYFSQNMETECFGFPAVGKCCIVNNSTTPQRTKIYYQKKLLKEIELSPMEMRWISIGR